MPELCPSVVFHNGTSLARLQHHHLTCSVLFAMRGYGGMQQAQLQNTTFAAALPTPCLSHPFAVVFEVPGKMISHTFFGAALGTHT